MDTDNHEEIYHEYRMVRIVPTLDGSLTHTNVKQ